jgi:hypothetical protein
MTSPALPPVVRQPMRNAGMVAGIGLLWMSVLAGFATFGVVDPVTTPDDTATALFRSACSPWS